MNKNNFPGISDKDYVALLEHIQFGRKKLEVSNIEPSYVVSLKDGKLVKEQKPSVQRTITTGQYYDILVKLASINPETAIGFVSWACLDASGFDEDDD